MTDVIRVGLRSVLPQESITQSVSASRMYHIAERLQLPFYILCNDVVGRLMTVLTPGEFGNYDSVKLEVIRRIFLLCLSPFIAVISLVSYLFSIPFNYTGDSLLGEQSYLCLKGNYNGPPKDRFGTFNMSTLLPPMTLIDGVTYSQDRLKKIAQMVKDLHFVCGQEVSGASARFLSEELKESFSHFYTYCGKSNVPLISSGLFFACKEKPLEVKVIPYTGPVEKGIKRVVFIAELANYYVISTHLDRGNGEGVSHIHAEEIKQIFTAIQSYNKPIVLCGDLNEDRYEPTDAYRLLTEKFVDCIKVQRPKERVITCTDALKRARFGKDGSATEESIDFIGCNNNQERLRVEFINIEANFEVSDHRLVIGQITELSNLT